MRNIFRVCFMATKAWSSTIDFNTSLFDLNNGALHIFCIRDVKLSSI